MWILTNAALSYPGPMIIQTLVMILCCALKDSSHLKIVLFHIRTFHMDFHIRNMCTELERFCITEGPLHIHRRSSQTKIKGWGGGSDTGECESRTN